MKYFFLVLIFVLIVTVDALGNDGVSWAGNEILLGVFDEAIVLPDNMQVAVYNKCVLHHQIVEAIGSYKPEFVSRVFPHFDPLYYKEFYGIPPLHC